MLVMFVMLTTVLLVLTRVKYPRLDAYDGRYTSLGPSANQPTAGAPDP